MQPNIPIPPHNALRLRAVSKRTGLSRATIYRLCASGDFPCPVKLSQRVSAWDEAVIDAWLKAKFEGGNA